jgi:carboxypeptidase Taq
VQEFPVVDTEGRVHYEPFYSVLGFAPTDNGLAMLCRVSQKQVVNVAQHGGLAPVLIGYPPDDLRAPMRAAVPRDVAETRLTEKIRELRDLDAVVSLMDWDEETYLPTGGHERRGQQMGTVETIAHDLLVDDALGDLIEEVAEQTRDDPLWQAEIAELKRTRRIELAVPHDLVGALAEARSLALAAWEDARKADDFHLFDRPFTELMKLIRERAQALQRGGDLYDGLLDEYEPGMTRAKLDPLLRKLGERLRELVPILTERTRSAGLKATGGISEPDQEAFCRALLDDMGFSFSRGRVDRSTHPFTTMLGEDDVRLTLRFRPENPLSAIFATLHEGGHALYDQGYPVELHDTLLAEAPSTGIHESQARLWENHVGRNPAFWTHYLPRLQARFPAALGAVDAAAFQRAVSVVQPTLIRADADEVTYNLHILMRYELETALLSGDLPVSDLPSAWNDSSRKWLGIAPTTVGDGCLQDVHWAGASIGYFPTYTIGNLYAAQLAESYAAQADFGAQLASGNLRPLRDWLAINVYQWGCRLDAEEIIRKATGRGLDPEALFRHLAGAGF